MAMLNRPALADFLRTVPSKAQRALNTDSFRPAASAKLYAEVGCSSPWVMPYQPRCTSESECASQPIRSK